MNENVTELFNLFESDGKKITHQSKNIFEGIIGNKNLEEMICFFQNKSAVEFVSCYLLKSNSTDREIDNLLYLLTAEPSVITGLGSMGLAYHLVPIIATLNNSDKVKILSSPKSINNLAQSDNSGAVIDVVKGLSETDQYLLLSNKDVFESIFSLIGGSEAIVDILSDFKNIDSIISLLHINGTYEGAFVSNELIRCINSDECQKLSQMFDLEDQIEILKIKGVIEQLCATPIIFFNILDKINGSAQKTDLLLFSDVAVMLLCENKASDLIVSVIKKLDQKEKVNILTSVATNNTYETRIQFRYGPSTSLAIYNPDGLINILSDIENSNDKAKILLSEDTFVNLANRCKPDILVEFISSIKNPTHRVEILSRIIGLGRYISSEHSAKLKDIIRDIENFENYKEILAIILETVKGRWGNL